ncbi:MAG: phage terminase large subunit family protein [Thermodesulfobacteriota bacterium]
MGILDSIIPQGAAERLRPRERIPFPEWIARAGITIRGEPYQTRGHEYLEAILRDDHPDQVFEKGAQVGISTLVLMKALYVAEHLGKKTVYYFQDDGAVSDFSSDRAQPMIRDSAYLTERVRDTDRVGLKQIGAGSLYFRGLFTKGKAKSVDADFVILDELDEAKQAHKEFALDRLMHSDLQWVHALSQPSFPSYGIDAEFNETDQRYWHLICPACGHRNCLEIDFPGNFLPVPTSQARSFPDGATHYRGCGRCRTKLDPARGEWIAKYSERRRRGYHLSQLYTQIRPADAPNYATKIMTTWHAAQGSQIKLSRFTISILGYPYAGADARITDEVLDAIEVPGMFLTAGAYGTFMGVDQGDILTIAICVLTAGGRLQGVYFEETEDWGRLDVLMAQYGVVMANIDAMPNKDSAKAFAVRYPNRVVIQYFGGKELKEGEELHRGKQKVHTVSVDRTESLDATVDGLCAGDILLPARSGLSGRNLVTMDNVRRHLKQLMARNEESPSGQTRRVYLTGVENHYGMATNSARIAALELGIKAPAPNVMPVFRKPGRA